MSMAFVRLGCILPFMTASAIALSVCSGVGGCLCPNSSSMILMHTVLRAIVYSPASYASVADDMAFLMMCAMFSTAPLLGGMVVSLDRKKCPPALLHALGSLKQLALLCTANVMSLA